VKLLLDACVWGGAEVELAAVGHDVVHAGIVRLVGIAARQQGSVCITLIEQYEAQLTAGAIVTTTSTS
jgi:hypothetical protein